MTVAAAAAKAGPYTGNDSASAFDFAFKVFADTDIRVVATVIATGVESDLVLNTDYTVARNVDQDNDPGGTVTYKVGGGTTAYPSTHKLTIVGDFTYEQPTDIPNGGAFFATIIENALDRLTMLIKQAQEKLERAVVVDVSGTTDPAALIDDLTEASATAVASAATAQAAQALAEAAQALAEAAAASITVGVAATNVVQVDQAVTATVRAATTTLGTTLKHTLSDTSATVTAFNGVAGVTYHCRALGAGAITHHAANLIITQTGASITTAAGDTFDVYMLTATTCRIENYQRASGLPVSHDTIYTTGGTSTAYTLTTTNPRASLAVGQRFKVKFHAANGAAPTINIDGLGATPLVRENVDGALSALAAHTAAAPCIAANHYTEIEVLSGSQIRVVSLPPRVFSGTLTRDLTAASGDVPLTGIGFAPRKITFYSKIAGTIIGSVGFAGGAGNGAGQCVFSSYVATADNYNTSACIVAYQASGAYQVATCAFNSDGFTLTWTKTNSPTGTLGIIYHAEE